MKEFTSRALDIGRSAKLEDMDIRIIHTRNEKLVVKNGDISALDAGETIGFGVRVLYDGAWGFASSPDLTLKEVDRVTQQAVAIAKASSTLKKDKVRLTDEKAVTDYWHTPYMIDPWAVSLGDKLDYLFKIDAILSKKKLIKHRQAQMSFTKEHKWFASLNGSFIEQLFLRSGAGFECLAANNTESQIRSFPASFGGQYKSMGYELIHSLKLLENAERIREDAIQLLDADECPEGNIDLILMPNQMMLQIHESVGHATELDRVLGYEANYAGTSFATTEKLNAFDYGSPIVNLVADSTLAGGLATMGYDDDGVKAQRWHIVKEGMLNGYMTNRETAETLGFGQSNGCNRATNYSYIPITRIANLSLMPGDQTFESLFSGVDHGILMDTNKCWSIDQRRLNFQFGCEIAWEIKDGRLGRMLKNPMYGGITPQFWKACDGIASADYWDAWGIMNCGKGQPSQTNWMSHGSSPARFRGIRVGHS